MKILLLWKELKLVTLALSTIKRGDPLSPPPHHHNSAEDNANQISHDIKRLYPLTVRPSWLKVTRLTHSCEFSWFF